MVAVRDPSIKGSGYKDPQGNNSPYLNALIQEGVGWDENSGPITYYLGTRADAISRSIRDADQFADWSDAEATSIARAFDAYASVSKLTFQRTFDITQANLVEWKVPGGHVAEGDGKHEYPNGNIDHEASATYQIWGEYEYNGRDPSPWAPQYKGGTGFWMLLHELGHAMGLEHPHEGGFPGVTNSESLGTNHENQTPFTVMGYNRVWEGDQPRPDFTYGNMASLGALDIAAIQTLYGVNTTYQNGGNTYILGAQWWECIWDTGGVDTIDNRNSPAAAVIDLRAATLVEGPNAGGYRSYVNGIAGGFTIAHGVKIENAHGGTGSDTIFGNEFANTLDGNAGLDYISGGRGDDVYNLFDVTNGQYDVIGEALNEGSDTVLVRDVSSSVRSYTIPVNIEGGAIVGANASGFTLIGNSLGNTMFDDIGSNTLDGGGGDDELHGGNGLDILRGGPGNDRFRLEDRTFGLYDSVEEKDGEGRDHVLVTPIHVDGADYYMLTSFVESAELLGSMAFDLFGNTSDNSLFGNSGANRLYGRDGSDKLSGSGGDDTLNGGAGDDFYFLEDLIIGNGFVLTRYDTVVEDVNAGIDTVVVSPLDNPDTVSDGYALGLNIENGEIVGSRAFYLEGNELANKLTGNSAANTLYGYEHNDTLNGRGGEDTLEGGDGDDTYILDDLIIGIGVIPTHYDTVIEEANAGIDKVIVSPLDNPDSVGDGYTLGANIENGDIAGSREFYLEGNALANKLIGNSAVNTLYGHEGHDTLDGGAGADYLLGGDGNDTYNVDNTYDVVDEDVLYAGWGHGGTDTIVSTANWYWDVYSIGERMQIAANASDPTNAGTTLIGSIFNNEMIGNAKTNVLFGRGGADTYRAGDGIDYISLSLLGLTNQNSYNGVNGANTIIVDKRTSGANSYDIIYEFEHAKDKVNVHSYGYTNVNQVLARGHDDGAGNSYFALGDGLDYVYFVGLTKAQITGIDFII